MICFYRNEIDSCACANIVSTHLKIRDKNAYILYTGMENIDIESLKCTNIWFAGIPFTEKDIPYIKQLLTLNITIVWYDDHKSSSKLIKKYPFLKNIHGNVDINKSSSCALYTKLFAKRVNDLPHYLQLINEYEMTKKTFSVRSEVLSFIYGMSKEYYNPLAGVWDAFYFGFITAHNIKERGKDIIKYASYLNSINLSDNSYIATYNNMNYLCINNDLQHEILDINLPIDNTIIIVSWYFDGVKYQYTASSRSISRACLHEFKDIDTMHGNENYVKFSSDKNIFVNRRG